MLLQDLSWFRLQCSLNLFDTLYWQVSLPVQGMSLPFCFNQADQSSFALAGAYCLMADMPRPCTTGYVCTRSRVKRVNRVNEMGWVLMCQDRRGFL